MGRNRGGGMREGVGRETEWMGGEIGRGGVRDRKGWGERQRGWGGETEEVR